MNILILVLSYNEPPYSDLMKAQQDTFGSVNVFTQAHPPIFTVYYYGGEDKNKEIELKRVGSDESSRSWELKTHDTDSYFYMTGKFRTALEYVSEWDYDIIFRTNSSSYINKEALYRFAETLPKEKLYAGWTTVDSEDHGGLVVSGAGIWLSHDCADILREQIDPEVEREEDVEIGRILRRNGIVAIDDKSRYDVGEYIDDTIPNDRYHYRLKNADRYLDSQNFYRLHEKLK